MRLSGWRARSPGRDGVSAKVIDAVGGILDALGAQSDPHCWVSWGDETGSRWTLLAPCPPGLAVVNVRAGGVGEGPRASGRLIRWSKVQVGELAAETERGHHLVMFQIEGQPIRGVDGAADDVAAFAALTLAGLEGQPLPDLDLRARRRRATAKPIARGGKSLPARPAAKSGPKPVAKSRAKPAPMPAAKLLPALATGPVSPTPAARRPTRPAASRGASR